MKNIFKQGDTIIEVTLAVSLFAMMMVASLSLMNAGLSKSQATLQLTMARNTIDAQAESLRFINSSFISQYPRVGGMTGPAAQWENITRNPSTSASALNECRTNFNPTNVFIIDTQTMTYRSSSSGANFSQAETYPQLTYGPDTNANLNKGAYMGSRGVWVEAVKSSSANESNYYDFHIRACWMPSGSNVKTTLGTIVRLYDPR